MPAYTNGVQAQPISLAYYLLASVDLQRTPQGDVVAVPAEAAAFRDILGRTFQMSATVTLLPGDVVLTGTPAGVVPLAGGDRLELRLAGVSWRRRLWWMPASACCPASWATRRRPRRRVSRAGCWNTPITPDPKYGMNALFQRFYCQVIMKRLKNGDCRGCS